MQLIDQRDPEVPVDAACYALNVSRASLYRARRPSAPSTPAVTRVRAPSPRRLDDAERQHILDTLHLPEFADQPPAEVYATLLGRGTYLASIRTIYRVLAEAGELRDRRNQRAPQSHTMPSLTATAPNQVWTWDITKLATLHKGVFLMAYVIIDLFSRFVVGWMVAAKECKHLAAQLFAETIARHGVAPGLQVHADRGSAMKSDTLAQLLDSLGASRSFSRPRVSNDNPYSEAQFKTLKYQPDYPAASPPTSTAAPGSRISSHGTTTTTITQDSPCSHRPTSSTAASRASHGHDSSRSTLPIARIPSASPTARPACHYRPWQSTSTRSSPRLSRSLRRPRSPRARRRPSPRTLHRIPTPSVSNALTRSGSL